MIVMKPYRLPVELPCFVKEISQTCIASIFKVLPNLGVMPKVSCNKRLLMDSSKVCQIIFRPTAFRDNFLVHKHIKSNIFCSQMTVSPLSYS